jgi:hypothetical protein
MAIDLFHANSKGFIVPILADKGCHATKYRYRIRGCLDIYNKMDLALSICHLLQFLLLIFVPSTEDLVAYSVRCNREPAVDVSI